ncbi:hypothetical protein OHB41_07860 [Streptomyces sp. NBC_01571]|uniref:hypothetical protein n=1 Tax=Streptomyces sp. NBC_01571 TaxID=2975883 RepID=UPI00224E6F3E|nr:hypothetical protein [Streptomyces sp. NBC_01571]MCX4573101.1 hypothetical protein [Streptomyces sp. NBC_01571]
MNEREALELIRGLLTEALGQPGHPTTYVRDLAGRIGELRATMRAALAVAEQADVQRSVDRAFPVVAAFLAEERERPVDPEVLAWHQGAIEGDPAVCGAPQPDQPAFPCIWNRSAHVDHRDLLGRTWKAGEDR